MKTATKPKRRKPAAASAPALKPFITRLPTPLIKALDKQAAANFRSRNAEIGAILTASLAGE